MMSESLIAMDYVAPAEDIKKLREWLEHDANATEWAKLKLQGDERAEILEAARWRLTNKVLKPLSVDLNDAGLEELTMLEELVKVTLPFDRANACMIMKLNRADKNCPNGFMWITDAQLSKITEDKVPAFGEQKQRASITSAYLRVADFCPSVKDYITDMTKTAFPIWMVKSGWADGFKWVYMF